MHSEIPEPYKSTFPSLTEMNDGTVYYDCSLCGEMVEVTEHLVLLWKGEPIEEMNKKFKKIIWETRKRQFDEHLLNKHDSAEFCEICNELVPIGKGVYIGGGRGVHLEKCSKIHGRDISQEQRIKDKLRLRKESKEVDKHILDMRQRFFIGDIVYCNGSYKGMAKIIKVSVGRTIDKVEDTYIERPFLIPDAGANLKLSNGEEFHIGTGYLKKISIIGGILWFFSKFKYRGESQ